MDSKIETNLELEMKKQSFIFNIESINQYEWYVLKKTEIQLIASFENGSM